uniref:Uncharacterized protein n=1 Tax=Homalodisca liturata TaxID=320908 RepID=A0A1B6K6M3_9HEMI
MITVLVVALCYFCCVLRVSSAPIIKTSGIQWSEPKGTGKGNITLIMVPQGYSSSNDSDDMIVAVKSDYQIMSQDTQLLNLIVNERQNDESNLTNYDSDFKNCVNSKHNEEPNSKIKCLNTANYFESKVQNIPQEIKNHSVISSNPLDDEDKNSIPRRENKKVNYADEMQIFEFLKFTTPSDDKPQTEKNKLNLSHTTESLAHLYGTDDYLNNTPSFGSSINVYQLLVDISGSNTDKDQFNKNNHDYLSTERTINVSNLLIRTNPNYVLNHSNKTNVNFSTTHTESTLNIYNFLNIIDTNDKNLSLLDQSSATSTESTINLIAFLNNAMEQRSENKILNNTKFQGNNDNTNFSIKMPSKESFLNEALTIIDNFKQNPSYYKNELNGDFHTNIRDEREQKQPRFYETKLKDLKGDDLALATDDDEIVGKECQNPGVYIKDISNIEENSGINKMSTPDICESFFIIDDNQTHNIISTSPNPGESLDKLVLTYEKSSNNETDKGSGTVKPSDGDNAMSKSEQILPVLSSVISKTTLADIGTSIAITQSSMTEEKSSPVVLAITNTIVKPSDTTYLNEPNNSPFLRPTATPTEMKSEIITQAYSTDQPNISPSADICTKIIIVPCNSTKSNEVFEKISDMIAEKTESPSKVKSSDGGSPQKAKQAIPTKITLEPKDECETIFGAKTETHTTPKQIEDNSGGGQLEDNDLKLPLEGSPVFLYYNNEPLREFDIPTDINSSLSKLRITGLHGKSDHMIERVAEVQNNNHLVLNALQNPTVVKNSGKNTTVSKSSIPVKEKDLNSMDVNKILKIHFAGKNEVSKQKLRTNVDVEPEKKL